MIWEIKKEELENIEIPYVYYSFTDSSFIYYLKKEKIVYFNCNYYKNFFIELNNYLKKNKYYILIKSENSFLVKDLQEKEYLELEKSKRSVCGEKEFIYNKVLNSLIMSFYFLELLIGKTKNENSVVNFYERIKLLVTDYDNGDE